jgi:3-deoxy-manno-octulosonate cytidylyltransferase (CMP-KDO synthetase)
MTLKKNDFLIVIPARINSKRLPEKAIRKINGIPMVIRTYMQCNKVIPKDNIIVATDSKKIIDICGKYNVPTILTSNKCLTGTDRVFEVSKKIKKNFYINLQGDEPIFNPNDIIKFLKVSLKDKNYVYNGYTLIKSKRDFFNLSVPKLVFNKKKELMYISRSPIPINKKGIFTKAFRQVCIYSFPKEFLHKFGKMKKKSFFEKNEDIEIIRFIENGLKVKMIKLSDKSVSVDTYDDLDYVRRLISKKL